jgi:hypothetical protein
MELAPNNDGLNGECLCAGTVPVQFHAAAILQGATI